MERSYAADNACELERLRALVSKLSDQDLGSMIDANYMPGATEQDRAELAKVVDSIAFTP